ncbi:MAG: right-handed parallel beta-helix repeat-containing protein, partial [Phycisphaerales bacterium]|nr:right-handed parallel beta-helix repeat-containing protein [Phycisphaerales bacterium]
MGRGFVFNRNETAESVLDGLTIRGGRSTDGGGVYIGNPTSSSPTIRRCVITSNFATINGGGVYISSSSPLIEDCTISENGGDYFAGRGGGVYIAGGAPVLRRCSIVGNEFEGSGAGLAGSNTAALVERCTVRENRASGSGGGVYFNVSAATLEACTISQNVATLDGGGVVLTGLSAPVVRNSLIHDNHSTLFDGAGIFCSFKTNPTIIGCTVSRNLALNGRGGGLIVEDDSDAVVDSCVLWGNGASVGAEIALNGWPASSLSIGYSDVAGGLSGIAVSGGQSVFWDAVSNLNANPRFTNPAVGSFHLRPISPCINRGDPDAVFESGAIDLNGDPRVLYGRVDLGVDEFNADCNGNGQPDGQDIAGGEGDCNGNGIPDECIALEGDCNANGLPDNCDIAGGGSSDCNLNGAPDECESECNANGVPDDCDINGGASEDCNVNAMPDECDIDAGDSADCNVNSVPDECDIHDCTVSTACSDCNGDGVPDGCQLEINDCNANGVPDDCEADCNRNTVPDECDLSNGSADDCNGDVVPDICEVRLHVAVSGSASAGFIDGIRAGGHLVTEFGVFALPQDLSAFDVVVLAPVSGAIAPAGAAMVDAFVAEGGGLIIIQGIYATFGGDSAPFSSLGTLAVRANTTVVSPGDPVASGLAETSSLVGPSATVVLKPGAETVVQWSGDGVPMAVTYAYGEGRVVYFNDVDACFFDANWEGDTVYGTAMMNNAVAHVGGAARNDCDGNGVPDDCDIAAEPSRDCDGNLVPDDCDVAAYGDVVDVNGNGIPDVCEGCAGGSACSDGDVCTSDGCLAGVCTHTDIVFGDVNHDDAVDIFDILCVLDGFAGAFATCTMADAELAPCPGGDGVIDIFDILAVLDAFAGNNACDCPAGP